MGGFNLVNKIYGTVYLEGWIRIENSNGYGQRSQDVDLDSLVDLSRFLPEEQADGRRSMLIPGECVTAVKRIYSSKIDIFDILCKFFNKNHFRSYGSLSCRDGVTSADQVPQSIFFETQRIAPHIEQNTTFTVYGYNNGLNQVAIWLLIN